MLQQDKNNIPKHVAIIMDGNGRWAKQQGRLRVFGHKNGVKAVQEAVAYATKTGINYLTLYAFSSENWQRPAKEVSALMLLFMQSLENQAEMLHKNNIKLQIIGNINPFNQSLKNKICQVEKMTAHNTGLTLTIAANYGGRWDILQAAKKLVRNVQDGELLLDDLENLTENEFQSRLATKNMPPVDLLIRTSGEQRLSNFLLWQAAYAEFVFTDVLWPDFCEATFHQAVLTFQQRERRFGGA